jgi:hypothetical protein
VLLHFGCRFVQGYGVARPMPVEQTVDWMAKWQAAAVWRGMVVASVNEDLMFKVAARSSSLWLDAIAEQLEREEVALPINAEPENCSFCRWFRSAGFTRYGQYPRYQNVANSHERSHALALQAQQAQREGRREDCLQLLIALGESKTRQMQDLLQLQQSSKAKAP